MASQRLYVVHGMGKDVIGVVGRITKPIAQVRGNIVDLRKDVLHGLLSVYMVVDLAASSLTLASFRSIIDEISEDTGLSLTVREFATQPRNPDKKSLLIICIGNDRPGLIAACSEMLQNYRATIEFANCISRENVFLMELLTDVTYITVPLDVFKRCIRGSTEALKITTVFQEEHVFLKHKRVILFHIQSSFLDRPTLLEIVGQAGLTVEDLLRAYPSRGLIPTLEAALSRLGGLPLGHVRDALRGVSTTAASVELIQTLKVMGYSVALASAGFSFVTDHIARQLDIDHAYGVGHAVDGEGRILAQLITDQPGCHDMARVLSQLTAAEQVPREDITIINDDECPETPGIRLAFDLPLLLQGYRQQAMSRDHVIGLLGSFGLPRLQAPEQGE